MTSATGDPLAANNSATQTTGVVEGGGGGGGASCGGATPTIVGTSGADVLKGTTGRDVILARGGADQVNSVGGRDLICAGAGKDEVKAGPARAGVSRRSRGRGARMSGMSLPSHLPDSRQSLLGYDHEGDEVWLIRGISQKAYTCPGCYGTVEIGEDHVIAQTIHRLGGTEHRHWHRGCALRTLVPGLRRVKPVNAREAGRSKLESRGKRPAGKRGRRTPRR